MVINSARLKCPPIPILNFEHINLEGVVYTSQYKISPNFGTVQNIGNYALQLN